MVYISYTGVETKKRCGTQYKLHYRDKLRPQVIGSALHWGSAIDEALNVLLLSKKKKLTKEEKKLFEDRKDYPNSPYLYTDETRQFLKGGISQAQYVFEEYWYQAEIALRTPGGEGSEWVTLPTSNYIEYFKKDFDEKLLTNEDLNSLRDFIENAGYQISEDDKTRPEPIDLFYELRELKDDKGILEDLTDLGYYNYCHWLSLRRKGLAFIKCYEDEILPQISEVKSVQKNVKLPNNEGDFFVGIVDAELSFKEEPGVFYTTDNKTSSRKYKLSDINEKHQIPSYDEYTGNNKGAYIVLLKDLKVGRICSKCGETTVGMRGKVCNNKESGKKCGGEFKAETKSIVEYQILKDDILDESKDNFFNDLDDVLLKIKAGVFDQNRDECFQFGRKCPYYYYCRSDVDQRDVDTIRLVNQKKSK